MNRYVVTHPPFVIEADTIEEAVEKLADIMRSKDWEETLNATPVSEIAQALQFYADPESYFATFIVPDHPAGPFADDIGCCLFDGEHDHRHGRAARRALGDEWGGTEPCAEFLASNGA